MIARERIGDIERIILSRPDRRNALTPAMLADLAAHIEKAGDAGGLLLLGEGRVFCAGFDLDLCVGESGDANLASLLTDLSRCVVAMRSLPCPVVMGVQGAAIAGGCALLGGGDVVIAHPEAKLGYPVTRLGISPAVSAPFMATAPGQARRLMLDPGLIDGRRGHEIGLVHELHDEPAARAMELAEELASKPPHALAATKRWLNDLTHSDAHDGLATSLSLVGNTESHELLAAALRRK
ncbi:MAG: enoyl-CoA hydratase/isomerase family protein [Phycisphaerales bacterium JB060]